MRQYSLFTHGNSLRVEAPEVLLDYRHFGWGAQIAFKPPPADDDSKGLPQLFAVEGPGTWFHLPLTSTLTTFGRQNPRLSSITLLYETTYCRITDIHVYDGAEIVAQFAEPRFGFHGSFLSARNLQDIDPERPLSSPQALNNTHELLPPHNVRSAIGVSFRAAAFHADYRIGGFFDDPHFRGPLPPATLVVAAAGGQFLVDDTPLLTVHLRDSVSITLDRIGRDGP